MTSRHSFGAFRSTDDAPSHLDQPTDNRTTPVNINNMTVGAPPVRGQEEEEGGKDYIDQWKWRLNQWTPEAWAYYVAEGESESKSTSC